MEDERELTEGRILRSLAMTRRKKKEKRGSHMSEYDHARIGSLLVDKISKKKYACT